MKQWVSDLTAHMEELAVRGWSNGPRDAEKEHMVTLLPLVSQKIDIKPSELVALAEREREREENGMLMSCELCLTRERYR